MERSGVRFEISECLTRLRAFKLLIEKNASKLSNGLAAESLLDIPFVSGQIVDPDQANYNYDNPCPSAAVRVARFNAGRAAAGLAPYIGYANLQAVPANILKLAMPMPHEIEMDDHAYALTILSVWEDRAEANQLLAACGSSGRALGPFLDAIERQAVPEDLTLVTGLRDSIVQKGLRGQELTFQTFKDFLKRFNTAEVACPPAVRKTDDQLRQMIGNLFILDPGMRKTWSENINKPEVVNVLGVRLSGPPPPGTPW